MSGPDTGQQEQTSKKTMRLSLKQARDLLRRDIRDLALVLLRFGDVVVHLDRAWLATVAAWVGLTEHL